MGSFDRDYAGAIMGGMGSIFAAVFSPVLAMVLGVMYGLIVSGVYGVMKLIAAAAWMIAFFPVLMWLDVRCVPVGVLYVYLLYCYWWKRRRLGAWFLLCGVSAFYSHALRDTPFWPILIFWVVLAMAWMGIHLYVRRNYLALEKMQVKDLYTEEERSRPPASQGICRTCGRYSDRIYYLPDGSRLCETCYEAAAGSPNPAGRSDHSDHSKKGSV
ncbi:MAG: hypothetical protein JW849_00715 [Phycisphaerae bacterium]|nr:hypothetical protein [Phycisphaerae bacterium]